MLIFDKNSPSSQYLPRGYPNKILLERPHRGGSESILPYIKKSTTKERETPQNENTFTKNATNNISLT